MIPHYNNIFLSWNNVPRWGKCLKFLDIILISEFKPKFKMFNPHSILYLIYIEIIYKDIEILRANTNTNTNRTGE